MGESRKKGVVFFLGFFVCLAVLSINELNSFLSGTFRFEKIDGQYVFFRNGVRTPIEVYKDFLIEKFVVCFGVGMAFEIISFYKNN